MCETISSAACPPKQPECDWIRGWQLTGKRAAVSASWAFCRTLLAAILEETLSGGGTVGLGFVAAGIIVLGAGILSLAEVTAPGVPALGGEAVV